MSFFRVRFGVVQRSEGGAVIARSAYQSCGRLQGPDGRVFDFTGGREEHGHLQTIMMAPPGSPAWALDILQCWTKATLAEKRVDAQEGRTMELSLPRCLPPNLWEGCARAVAAPFLDEGMVIQADLQVPQASDGGDNGHVHFLMGMRRVEVEGFAVKKERSWNRLFYRDPKKLRREIASIMKEFCARHEISYEPDVRSNEERGLPEPEQTLPRWNIHVTKRTGRPTVWLQERDEARQAKHRLAAFETELASVNEAIRIKQMVEPLRARAPASAFVAFIDAKPVPARPAAARRASTAKLARALEMRPHRTPSIVPTETQTDVRDHEESSLLPCP